MRVLALSSLLTLLIMLGGFYSVSSFAFFRIDTPCVKILKKVNQSIEHGFLGVQELDQVASIFADKSLSDQEKAQSAFDFVVDARLSQLPPGQAHELRKILASIVRVDGSAFAAHFSTISNNIHLRSPTSLEGSVHEYAVIIHELEHAIQFTTAGDNGKAISLFEMATNALFQLDNLRFNQELGAMTAEWQFLHAIPLEERKIMAQELALNQSLAKEHKEHLLRSMSTEAESPQEYLMQEWGEGRYARGSHHINQAAILTSIFGTVLITKAMLRLHCVDSFNRGETNSSFYQKLCKRLGPEF